MTWGKVSRVGGKEVVNVIDFSSNVQKARFGEMGQVADSFGEKNFRSLVSFEC